MEGGHGSDRLVLTFGLPSTVYTENLSGSLATGYSGVFNGYHDYDVSFSGIESFTVISGPDGDSIVTGDGNDIFDMRNGSDSVHAGGGADIMKGGQGYDLFDGGDGTDTADFSDKTGAVGVTLNGATDATVTVGGVAEDTVRNIENVYGRHRRRHPDRRRARPTSSSAMPAATC